MILLIIYCILVIDNNIGYCYFDLLFIVVRLYFMNDKYTGRKIAIFSDVHGLLEPLEAIMSDIQKRGITEIYSLGDNIGVGPSPCDVIDMLEYYNIKSVAGNAEEYCTLGIEPYKLSFDSDKLKCQMWTYSKLGNRRLHYIRQLPHSFDLNVGGKKIGLCHFANDVRTDYILHGTDEYMRHYGSGTAYMQFLYTNSIEHRENIRYNIEKYGVNNPYVKGFLSARDYPIFDGKMVNSYDTIIEGHVHRNLYEHGDGIDFYTIRAVAFHFDDDPIDLAFYIVLHERTNNMGFDIERVYVPFDRARMENTILRCDEPTKKIKRYVKMV